MSETYYKAVRPNGTDFHAGTVRWLPVKGEPLPEGGLIVTHPFVQRKPKRLASQRDAGLYLSVATVPTDCTGMLWPCRLARVERTRAAVWAPNKDDLPHKRASWRWQVVEELDPHLALGPQGADVAAIIARCHTLTPEEVRALSAAREAAWAAAWGASGWEARDAAWAAAWAAAREAAWDAAREAARDAVWAAAWGEARDAARDAVRATLVRDLISEAHYQTLMGPWLSVIGGERR